MAKKEINFSVKTKTPGLAKGVPVYKVKTQNFDNQEKAIHCRKAYQQKKELFIEVLDHANQVKTVYTKTLKEKNYSIITSKIIV
jgi:hypothetical protein